MRIVFLLLALAATACSEEPIATSEFRVRLLDSGTEPFQGCNWSISCSADSEPADCSHGIARVGSVIVVDVAERDDRVKASLEARYDGSGSQHVLDNGTETVFSVSSGFESIALDIKNCETVLIEVIE